MHNASSSTGGVGVVQIEGGVVGCGKILLEESTIGGTSAGELGTLVVLEDWGRGDWDDLPAGDNCGPSDDNIYILLHFVCFSLRFNFHIFFWFCEKF